MIVMGVTKNSRVITVDAEFAKMIEEGHNKTNILLQSKLKKRMTKIDYTNFLARVLKDDFNMFFARQVLQPIRKGRKTVRFNL